MIHDVRRHHPSRVTTGLAHRMLGQPRPRHPCPFRIILMWWTILRLASAYRPGCHVMFTHHVPITIPALRGYGRTMFTSSSHYT